MAAGANGYISKNIGADDLITLIKAFNHRQTAVSPNLVKLSISLETVKNHTKSIFRKLGGKNRVEAACNAMRHKPRA
jgi:DNA-binding NarL/FixJ family response regulator